MPQIFSHLQRHSTSGIFYFRLTVPEHLRLIIGKLEIKQSLRTSLRSEAILAAINTPRDGYIDYIGGTIKKPDGTKVTFNIEREDAAEEAQMAAQLFETGGTQLLQQAKKRHSRTG